MNKREKNFVAVAVFMVLLLVIMGSTYAYWTTTKVQEDENVINTTCLDVTLENKDDQQTDTYGITLDKTYPISDEEGLATKGYTFTVKNNCDAAVNFDINLESLKIDNNDFKEIPQDEAADAKTTRETNSYYIQSEYINATLNLATDKSFQALSHYTGTKSFLTSGLVSYEQRNLANHESLDGKQSKTYNLKLWLDKNAPETQMNKHYKGKIVIYSWLGNSNPNPIEVE